MKKRKTEPWMSAADYGRTLSGLSVNLIVRDVARSIPFYTRVLELRVLYSDEDHAYGRMPWATRLAEDSPRGLGAEIRILGIDPDAAERRARDGGFTVAVPVRDWPHGWRDCVLEDPDGYTFAVGVPL